VTKEHSIHETKHLNPFFSIWLSTRETVRYVLDYKTLSYSIFIVAIAGIPNALNASGELSKSFEVPFWVMLLGVLLLGPILGLIGWGISTVVFTLVGKWLGGTGTYKEMGQAMGVVTIPAIWMTPFWILSTIFINYDMYQLNVTSGFMSGGLMWMLVSSFIIITSSIWMIVIQSKAIGEVHQFSSMRGFGTLIIPGILFGLLAFILLMIFLIPFISSLSN
jgi:hypothetical protein